MTEVEKLLQHKDELIELLEPFEKEYLTEEVIRNIIQTFINFCSKYQIEMNLEINMFINLLLTGWKGLTIRQILNNSYTL